jgi:hypothetical protein
MKFKVGDKVRVVADERRLEEIHIPVRFYNKVGVIKETLACVSLPLCIIFDNVMCWYLDEQDLELVEGAGQPKLLTTKDTNPKDALASGKAPLSTLPTGPMYGVALAMLEGARKYGRHNYRIAGVKASVYYDAALGHITAWWEGEDTDSDSGLHHLDKAMACLAVVRDSIMMENWIDDRPPCYPDASKLMRNHPAVKTILGKYPNCVDPFTESGRQDRTKPVPGEY